MGLGEPPCVARSPRPSSPAHGRNNGVCRLGESWETIKRVKNWGGGGHKELKSTKPNKIPQRVVIGDATRQTKQYSKESALGASTWCSEKKKLPDQSSMWWLKRRASVVIHSVRELASNREPAAKAVPKPGNQVVERKKDTIWRDQMRRVSLSKNARKYHHKTKREEKVGRKNFPAYYTFPARPATEKERNMI